MVALCRGITQLKNLIKIRIPSIRSFADYNEKKIDVNGININVVINGHVKSKTKAVLLMPGALGTCWTDFKPQIEKLPSVLPDFAVIAWDPPGYGKSIPPKRYFGVDFYEKDAEVAVNLMKTLNFSYFDILGWSDGGITAMIAAAKYPQSIRKLVIWGSNAFIHPNEVEIYESIRDVSKWSQRMRTPMEKVYGKEEFAKLWSEWVDAVLCIYKKRNGDLCKDLLHKIKSETFILHGAKDPMIIAEHIPYLLDNIKGAKVFVFNEGKHNIHLKYPDEFNRLVAEFLSKE